MNPILFVALTLSACAIAHYSVAFLEPAKASVLKAVAFNAVLVLGANVAMRGGFNPGPVLQWTVYILIAAGLARVLYRLKLLNSVTVAACYVAGSYALAQVVSVGALTAGY